MTAKSDKPEKAAGGRPLRAAVFAGSFNPFTAGHASVVERGLRLFDRVIVAIGVNPAKEASDSDYERRLCAIRDLYADNPAVEVRLWKGLTVDLCRECGADFLLRGVRSVKDFEYERDMADINRRLAGIETVLIYSLPEHAALSSSVVRELDAYGADITEFLPKAK